MKKKKKKKCFSYCEIHYKLGKPLQLRSCVCMGAHRVTDIEKKIIPVLISTNKASGIIDRLRQKMRGREEQGRKEVNLHFSKLANTTTKHFFSFCFCFGFVVCLWMLLLFVCCFIKHTPQIGEHKYLKTTTTTCFRLEKSRKVMENKTSVTSFSS